MLFDIPAMIQSGCNMLGKFFGMKETSIEHQAETTIIKSNKDYKKACDISEQIIMLVTPYTDIMTEKDLKDFKKLTDKFYKYN